MVLSLFIPGIVLTILQRYSGDLRFPRVGCAGVRVFFRCVASRGERGGSR